MESTQVKIARYDQAVPRLPDHSHFAEVDILGMDLCRLYAVSQLNYFKKHRAKLVFGEIEGWFLTSSTAGRR